MRIHAKTTDEDFLDFLAYALRDAGMPASVLDCVDSLQRLVGIEGGLEKTQVDLEMMEERAKDLRNRLCALHEKSKLLTKAMSEGRLADVADMHMMLVEELEKSGGLLAAV